MRLRFSPHYALWTALVLAVELFIATQLDDALVRPYLGDTLAVILIYAALLSALSMKRRAAALTALCVACAVELAQSFELVERLGLSHLALARVVIGTRYDPRDFIAYAAAIPLILIAERGRRP